MAQDMNILAAAQRKFEQDKERRQAAFDRRVQQIYLRLPRLQEIDWELRGTAGRIVMAALESDGDPGPDGNPGTNGNSYSNIHPDAVPDQYPDPDSDGDSFGSGYRPGTSA